VLVVACAKVAPTVLVVLVSVVQISPFVMEAVSSYPVIATTVETVATPVSPAKFVQNKVAKNLALWKLPRSVTMVVSIPKPTHSTVGVAAQKTTNAHRNVMSARSA